MPHKFNASRRHKFDKAQYRVINWAEYNESLRQRGDLTIWVSEEAQNVWSAPRRTSRGGQRRYSDLAIETCLTLRTTYRLALRQTQGLMGSIGTLMGLDIRVPDYSTLSRRANGLSIAQAMRQAGSVAVHLVVDSTGLKIFGEGEWLAQKHKIKGIRRRWRKLHLGLDLASGAIVCADLTHDEVGDSTALPGLLDQLDAPVTGFLADVAYDGASIRDMLRQRYGETLDVVIPPPKNAVIRPQSARDPTVRDLHIAQIRSNGRMAWQVGHRVQPTQPDRNADRSLEERDWPQAQISQLLQADHGDPGRPESPEHNDRTRTACVRTYRLTLPLGKGRIPSPPRSMQQRSPAQGVLRQAGGHLWGADPDRRRLLLGLRVHRQGVAQRKGSERYLRWEKRRDRNRSTDRRRKEASARRLEHGMRLEPVARAVFICSTLAGCGAVQSIPGCGDEETFDLVKEIVQQEL